MIRKLTAGDGKLPATGPSPERQRTPLTLVVLCLASFIAVIDTNQSPKGLKRHIRTAVPEARREIRIAESVGCTTPRWPEEDGYWLCSLSSLHYRYAVLCS